MSENKKKVIIVGAGLAGFSAAIEAYQNGASVTLLEKTDKCGGNSFKATSGINGVGTEAQILINSQDTPVKFLKDTIKSGGGISKEDLAEKLVNESTEAVSFLTELGVDLSVLCQCGGHSEKRTHRAKPQEKIRNIGMTIMLTLIEFAKDKIEIIMKASLKELLTNKEGEVIGVKYEKDNEMIDLRGDNVVLCTGGWCADKSSDSLLNKYTPNLMSLPSTNGQFATGEGVKIAHKIGAGLIHMDKIQIHPTGFVSPKDPKSPTKWLCPEAVRASGGILINGKGKRFVNELGRRDHVTEKIFEQKDRYLVSEEVTDLESYPFVSYILLNEEARELFSPKFLDFYGRFGFVQKLENGEVFCKKFGIKNEVLKKTFTDYNKGAEKGQDEFEKTVFPVKNFDFEKPLWLLTITPSLHYSMGGLKMNKKSQVLNGEDKVIKGLYAAGETTGGVHGQNRLAGNSLLECVVYGRTAGINSALN
ncbi:fumarate reductase [Anaeramoeba flamelloides]|uniref:fumarate reductase (NADH) n=1 Tax=Anaeramoeba flamelloides TaxID=1746091 RepID=A0AAV8A7Z7_9EUKA|nr:fumarate reductase [Anaeramoeba flamelloides]|eukprot:Anaeramoba_flamelloidesc38013_g1_i1.p1 GENE.c38013_g1_i1~~c38013_g1_i1.p1  ORF type:complete len:476 (-),score=105.07 c38013_g1_i1:92-1519(-)